MIKKILILFIIGILAANPAGGQESNNWPSFTDKGILLLSEGKPKEALASFQKASDIATSRGDWRGLIAYAYAYSSLPEKMQKKDNVDIAVEKSFTIASSNQDWRGMLEAVKIYLKLEKTDKAQALLNSSLETIKEIQSWQAAAAFAKAAKEADDPDLYGEYFSLAEKFNALDKDLADPFPYERRPHIDQSISGPRRPSDVRMIIEQFYQIEVTARRRLLLEKENREKEIYNYYSEFQEYYDFP